MWSWWPSSWTPPPEPPGSALQALAVGTVMAAAAGNLWPPPALWVWPLGGTVLAAAFVALRSGRSLLWFGCGLLLGLAAVAAAPQALRPGAMPVRFAVVIRDGWVEGPRGWVTRVKVKEVYGPQGRIRTPRELTLALGGAATEGGLPPPGSRCEGAGELVYAPDNQLKAPLLRVKTLLLLRSTPQRGWTVDAWRDQLASRLHAAAGEKVHAKAGAALAAALILGRREALDREAVQSLRQAGVAHILAVSGLHVVLVSTLVWWCLTALGVPPRPRRLVLLPCLLGFAFLAGGSPPVLRATVAAMAYLLTRLAGRAVLPLPAMWGVVAALVALDPATLQQPGFQLSAGVSLALIRWVGPLSEAAQALPRWLGSALAVACVAQLASWPLAGVAFAAVPPLGVFANLLAAPLVFPLVATSLLAVLTVALAPSLGAPLVWLVGLGYGVLLRVSDWGSATTWLFAPPPPALLAIGAGVYVASVVAWKRAWLAGLAVAAASVLWTLFPGVARCPAMAVQMLPVGEGMALLVRTPHASVVVDTGRGPNEALRSLAAARIRRLDALVITHADLDHTGGAATLAQRVRIGEVVIPRLVANRPELQTLWAAARQRGVRVRPVAAGETLQWGEMRCRVVWPPSTGELGDNDSSLVALLEAGEARLLVTGDLEASGEAAVVASGVELQAEVLQLPHHGSRTSSSQFFLEAVRPRVALAATGVHPRFKVPHPQVVGRVRAVPALLAAQTGGVERVWWENGAVVVGTAKPVRLPLRKQ